MIQAGTPASPTARRPFRIGVMGSAAGQATENAKAQELTTKLGEAIADAGFEHVSGACPGLPHVSALGAKSHGGLTIGISPADSEEQHVAEYHSPVVGYDYILYTGMGLMQRDIVNIRATNAVILAGGRLGTTNEAIVAMLEGKPIGILEGTGGVADNFRRILQICGQEVRPNMLFSGDPKALPSQLYELAQKYPLPERDDAFRTDGGKLPEPPPLQTAAGKRDIFTSARRLVKRFEPNLQMDPRPFKISIAGAETGANARDPQANKLAWQLGEAIADANYQMVAGACPGLAHMAVVACHRAGGRVFGVSPADSEQQLVNEYQGPTDGFDFLQHTGMGVLESEVMNIRTGDALAIVGGGPETLNQFAIAWKEGKPIGVLTGSGGVADGIKEVLAITGDPEPANLVFSSDPQELVRKLYEVSQTHGAPVHRDAIVTDQKIDKG